MGDGDGDRGGFFISPAAIINIIAASAIGGLAVMALGNNADVALLKGTVASQADLIHRLEASNTATNQTIITIIGNQRGLLDAKDSLQADIKRLREDSLDITKRIDGMDFLLRPPRNSQQH